MSVERGFCWMASAVMGLALVSCAGDKANSAPPARESLSQRLSAGGAIAYEQAEDGTWKPPQADKRSSFESNRESAYFKRGFEGKEFHGTREIGRRGWWGAKEVSRTTFSGTPDGSRFLKPAAWQGQESTAASRRANESSGRFGAGTHATSAAREAGASRMERKSDARTDVRRRVFKTPDIVDWESHRNLSVSDTRRMLKGD